MDRKLKKSLKILLVLSVLATPFALGAVVWTQLSDPISADTSAVFDQAPALTLVAFDSTADPAPDAPTEQRDADGKLTHLRGHVVLHTLNLGGPFKAKLLDTLRSDVSNFGSDGPCPRYDFALRAPHNGGSLDMMLGYTCRQAAVYAGDSAAPTRQGLSQDPEAIKQLFLYHGLMLK